MTLTERQLAAEQRQMDVGRNNMAAVLRSSDAGDTPSGVLTVKLNTLRVAARIAEFMRECSDGKAGRGHRAYGYFLHLSDIGSDDPDADKRGQDAEAELWVSLGFLALRVGLTVAWKRTAFATACVAVSEAVEDHIRLTQLADEQKGNYKFLIQFLSRYTEGRRKQKMSRHLTNYAVARLPWTNADRIHVGALLLGFVEEVTGIITTERVTRRSNDTPDYVIMADESREGLEKLNDVISMVAVEHRPMLVPPRAWTSPYNGGYLRQDIKCWFVSVRKREQLSEYENLSMPLVYAAVNAVQETAWRINRPILALMEEAPRLGGLPDPEQFLLPTRPEWLTPGMEASDMTVDQAEEFKRWKQEAARRHEDHANEKVKQAAYLRARTLAQSFRDEDALFFPHYVDFRGRMYPFCEALSPQGSSWARALLEFKEGKPLGEDGAYWLAVHLANCFAAGSIDKAAFSARVQWVLDNEDAILESAMNPLDGARFWCEAEEPWLFLAGCLEWAGYRVQGDSFISHIPVNMDGSCSGLQHYSALLRDPVGGAAVNLVPGEKPADIYMEVAARAQARADAVANDTEADDRARTVALAWEGDRVVRKITKRPTMTLCYAATKFGMRDQIHKELDKLRPSKDEPFLNTNVSHFDASMFMAGVVWDAIGDVVVAARAGMEFLKECAAVCGQAGQTISWWSPVGFYTTQAYCEEVGVRVKAHYKGARADVIVAEDRTDRIDKRKQSSSIAPNFIHSMDAAHLMFTVVACGHEDVGISTWSVIHDSFGTHACNVGRLNEVLRETFVEQYSTSLLEQFRENVREGLVSMGHEKEAAKLPEVPPMGTLDLDAVRSSDYFFA